MKTNKNYYRMMAIGILMLNFDFILRRFITISDGWSGLIKGCGLGIMIAGLYLIVKYKKKHNIKSSCSS